MQSASSHDTHDTHDAHDAPPRAPSVLIIEDSPSNLIITRMTLEREQIPYDATDNVDDGWEKLQHGDFSVVITDLSLGGIPLIERMRATPRYASIPVIVSTGHGAQEKIEQALLAGAQAYLIKPYTLSTLVELVRRALNGDL